MRFYLICLLLLGIFSNTFATHNRAGEITFRQINGYEYEITLITYTNSLADPATNRPDVNISWGDNDVEMITRSSQIPIGNNTLKNIYIARHLYRGPGSYLINFIDPNRVENIENMNNSVGTAFYIETLLIINPFQGYNQSPQLLVPPIDFACRGKTFVHNPGAYDPDGDSLIYEIIPPKQKMNTPVSNYSTPDFTQFFTLNRFTGQLIWETPEKQGLYNIAIKITEYRNGVAIGFVVRDMQITVQECFNNPPVIRPIRDTCVEVGTVLRMPVFASDPDAGDRILLQGFGGSFIQASNPAFLENNPAIGIDSVQTFFHWELNCTHIQKAPYQVIIKASDRGMPPPVLVDMEEFNVTVVAAAPKNVTIVQSKDGFQLDWDDDICNASGYFVYRRTDSSHWNHNRCETGVAPVAGFQLIKTIEGTPNSSFYDDDNGRGLSPGLIYCYRITSYFLPVGGNGDFIASPPAESYSSIEVCKEMIKNRPVITNVSVRTTSQTTGSIFLAWSKPTAVDSIAHPGPYHYYIFRDLGLTGNNPQLFDTISNADFDLLNDSSLIDTFLNTTLPNNYTIHFYSGTDYIGKSRSASMVYLQHYPTDEALILSWTYDVPWLNDSFVLFKLNRTTNTFDSLAVVKGNTYIDDSLINGEQYCYKVLSIGHFQTPGYVDPILNLSQEHCGIPIDTIPPCPPKLEARDGCEDLINKLSYTNPNLSCADDVVFYNIYFKRKRNEPFVKIDSVPNAATTTYNDIREVLRKSIAGCYVVTAVDSFFNESKYSNEACVENCPVYKLPNVFTPGKDNFNDLFQPFPYRFIEKIDLHILNRWGNEVFATENIDINWNGTDQKNGKALSAGTYFYICDVYEIFLDETKKRTIKGTIQILPQ